jgi:hypothetical protein
MTSRSVVFAEPVRTAIGAFGGSRTCPAPVADVAPNTDLENSRFSSADSALGELANEMHQNTTTCRARVSAGGSEFGSVSKRNNTGTGWQPSHCGGSGHDPTNRHDGRTKSHADEGALSEALSATRASRRSDWYAGARPLLQEARLRSERGTHSCRRDRVYRRLQPMVGLVRAASRGAARSARYRRRAFGVARYVTQ